MNSKKKEMIDSNKVDNEGNKIYIIKTTEEIVIEQKMTVKSIEAKLKAMRDAFEQWKIEIDIEKAGYEAKIAELEAEINDMKSK